MRLPHAFAFVCLPLLFSAATGIPQPATPPTVSPATSTGTSTAAASPVSLEWTPPELAVLAQAAEVKNSFVLDRTLLGAAAAMLPSSDADTRQTIRKLDGVSVHLYRFHAEGEIDPVELQLIRDAYHARGWKHLVVADSKHEPMHTGNTDLWLAVDGMDVRGGTLLSVTPRSVSLVTFAGDLSPIDLLHLRGHFGIPGFSGEKFQEKP
jgi:hypothetical protein